MTSSAAGAAGATPRGAAPPALAFRGLSVDFGVEGRWVPAVRDVSFEIAPGEILAVVGESGSGKSVTAMAVLGLLPGNTRVSGAIDLDGEPVLGAPQKRMRQLRGERVAAIFQEPMTALNPVLPVGFQLAEAVRVHRSLSPREAASRAREFLELVELPDPDRMLRSFPHQLSGGQRQRVMIAQALVHDPRLLIADEPTTALDVTVQAEILDLVRRLRDRRDNAVLLITHDMGVVADLADRVVVMREGELVENRPVVELFAQPAHPYTRALLRAVPHLGQAQASGAPGAATAHDRRPPEEPAPARGGPEEAAPRALEMRGVSIDYGHGRQRTRAVTEASLRVDPGQIVGLVGESGSGKSTIGRAAVGLLPVSSGTLLIDGVDLSSWSRAGARRLRGRVGVVFQDPTASLNPRLPIGASIGEPIRLAKRAAGAALDRRVTELLDAVSLPVSARNRFPHELSGGQKQRVGIARALALRPALLIADEPTSALDVSVQATVLALLGELQAEFGFGCLFISHDLAVVDSLAEQVVVLRSGRVVEAGGREDILQRPREAYTQRLLASVPVPDPGEQRRRREARAALAADAPEPPLPE